MIDNLRDHFPLGSQVSRFAGVPACRIEDYFDVKIHAAGESRHRDGDGRNSASASISNSISVSDSFSNAAGGSGHGDGDMTRVGSDVWRGRSRQ